MTAEELRMEYLDNHPNGTFFNQGWLNFKGIKMEESRVYGPINIIDTENNPQEVWVLKELCHKHPLGPTTEEAYFKTDNFETVMMNRGN